MTDDEQAAERAALWAELDARTTAQAAQVRAAIDAMREMRSLRSFGPYRPDGWSFYDREALRSGHAGYDRKNYGL